MTSACVLARNPKYRLNKLSTRLHASMRMAEHADRCLSSDWASVRVFEQVHKFSKFIHGTATLLPELVQAVPYWVDDESVRPSMLQSAPQPAQSV